MFTDILIGDFVNPFMDRVLGSLAIFSPVQVCGSFPTLYVFGKVKFRTTFKPLVVRARPHVPHSTMWTNLYIYLPSFQTSKVVLIRPVKIINSDVTMDVASLILGSVTEKMTAAIVLTKEISVQKRLVLTSR